MEPEVLRAGDTVLVVFPPAWLGVELDDTDSDKRTAERPETLRQVIGRLPRVVAAVDGPMFDEPGAGYDRYERTRVVYRYLDKRRGVDVASLHPERGATLSVTPDGRASWARGAREVAGATFAVQGYPELLRDGENVANPSRDTERTGRAALLLLDDGRVGFAVGRAGMRAFAESLRTLRGVKVTQAVYTDGGGSTALAVRGVGSSLLVSVGLDSRRVPAYVIAEPPASGPAMTGMPWRLVVGGVGVVTVALWWLLRAIADDA